MTEFTDLPRGHFGAILADPPWNFVMYVHPKDENGYAAPRDDGHVRRPPYQCMDTAAIAALPIGDLAAEDCVLFLWVTWPHLLSGISVLTAWGFEYKTCAFSWTKAHAGQIDMFRDDLDATMGTGYWTRANTEPCLLATRGKPKRFNADVRQGIIEPRREHSRKPDCVHGRIERLVAGPYLELFARQRRPGWTVWGNETDRFPATQESWDEMWAKPFTGEPT